MGYLLGSKVKCKSLVTKSYYERKQMVEYSRYMNTWLCAAIDLHLTGNKSTERSTGIEELEANTNKLKHPNPQQHTPQAHTSTYPNPSSP